MLIVAASCTHSALQPAQPSIIGQSTAQGSSAAPREHISGGHQTDYFVNNIRGSKSTVTRKLGIITVVLLKLKVLKPVNMITVAMERMKTVKLFQMFSPNIQTEGKH